MNEAIFQEIHSDSVPNSMFRKRKTQHQINFKRRRRKHEIDLKPQSPLFVTRYLKNLLPQFFKHKKTQSEDTIRFVTSICSFEGRKNISPDLSEITRNFFARDELPIQSKSETSITNPKPKPSVKPKKLKKSNINLDENMENLIKQSLSASGILDTHFFSLKNPLQYSVYPVHIFHYKRNVSDNKHRSNPEASQEHKAEVIYERKCDDKIKCKAAKHNVKTSTKGLQLYSNTSTQFEDVSNEFSDLCQPQVTHKFAQYFEINPVPVTNNKREESEEKVTNLTTFTDYLDTRKGRSVLLNSHGKMSRKRDRDDNKERYFLCHDVNLSSSSTNKSSSNEDLRAIYKQCNKCSLNICNCANSMGNQQGSSNMLHNDCCTSTTEMCICSAMYPKFKEWYEFNSLQFNTDLKKWQEAQPLNVFNKEHHKLINKKQYFTAMQEDEEIIELNRKNMVDESVIVECLSGETLFVKSDEFHNVQNLENQRYPTFIGIPIENDEPVKDVSTTSKIDERKKKKILSDACLAENESELIEADTLKSYRDISTAKGASAQAQRPNLKTETECQIDLLKKSDFELVSDIEKMVENLIGRVPSLSKNIVSQSIFKKEPKPAEYWTPQEEPKTAEYWTLRKMSSKEVAPNLQLQPLNCFHLKQTQETFQEPQTIMPLFHKRTKCKPELNEMTLKSEKQISPQTISNLPKLQHISATAITISEPEISHTRTEAKLEKSAMKLSLSKLIQSRISDSKLDSNPKKERQRSDRISTITYIKKRDTLSPSKETQIFIKTQKGKKVDSNLNVIRSKASVSTKSSQSSNKSSVQSFIKSLLLCLKYSNSDSEISFHDISIQCSESTRDLLLKRSASHCSLKATDKTESLFSSYSTDIESVEKSDLLKNEETNTAVQKMVEKGTMKANVTNSVGVQVYITTKHVKDKKTSASSLARRRRKRKKQREASTQTYSDLFKPTLVEASSSSISLNKHKRQDHQVRQHQRSRKRKVITEKLQTSNVHPKEMAKLEKQLWNNFCNFILRFACGSFLRLSNERKQNTSAIDNVSELNNRSSVEFSVDLTSEKLKKSSNRSISIPNMLKHINSKTENFKPTRSKSFGDIGTCGQKTNVMNETTCVQNFESKRLQCNEIDLQLSTLENIEERTLSNFTKCNKNHDINVIGYHTSEESIFGMPASSGNMKSSDSSSDFKRYGDLFKPSTIPEGESSFTISERFKTSNQNNETSDSSFHSVLMPFHFETKSKYKICPTPVFQLNIVNLDTKLIENDDPVKENPLKIAKENAFLLESHVNESSEQYTFESLEARPIDDEHVLRLRFLWLKSGLRKHMSQLSNLKIMPIYDSEKLKRPSTTSETLPLPILKKIGAKPFDFKIVNEEKGRIIEKEEESGSVTTESTKTESRDAFIPIAQLVNVLSDKGKEKFEICAILSVSSDSEEEGMEFAKVIESEEGMKALLKTMEVVPHKIPKLKEAERKSTSSKTSEGSEVKVDDMDMTYTPSKLIVTVPLPKKERKEQNIDCLEQLKRKLCKIFSNKYLKDSEREISLTKKGDLATIDTIYEEEQLQSKQSHVIIDTSNKAYNDKTKRDETKRKFPTFKEIINTLPDNIKVLKDVPKKRQKSKLPILKDFTRTFSDKFKQGEQKIRLDSELPDASMQEERHGGTKETLKGKVKMPSFKTTKVSNKIEPFISKFNQTKPFQSRNCSCKQNDTRPKHISGNDDGDCQDDIQEKLHEFSKFERITLRKSEENRQIDEVSTISTETKIEEIRAKPRISTTKYNIKDMGFKPSQEKSKIPIRKTSTSFKFISAKRDKPSPDITEKVHIEKLESIPNKTHLKLNTLLNRLSNKLKETNDKIKQSIETTTCKVAKRKRDSREVTLIRLSKKLSQQNILENNAINDFSVEPYTSKKQVNGLKSEDSEHIEFPKHTVSEENVSNQIRKEINIRPFSSFSNIRDESETDKPAINSKMKCFDREVFKRTFEIKSPNFKFRGIVKHERHRDLTLRKLKDITKTIEKEGQTTVGCKCFRNNHLSNLEMKDASYHSQSMIIGGDLSKRNFQSQFNSKVPLGRLICDCKEFKTIQQMSRRQNYKTYNKSESFEKPLTFSDVGHSPIVPSTAKTGTSYTGPSRIARTLFKIKVINRQPGPKTEKNCQIKYCGIQHPVLNEERRCFKNNEKSVPQKPKNYCELENFGPLKIKQMESLQEEEPIQVKLTLHGNTKSIRSSTKISSLIQIPKDTAMCTAECQTRNFCRNGEYYIKQVRKTPIKDEPLQMVPTSRGSKDSIYSGTNSSCLEQICKLEACTTECQSRNFCHGKCHMKDEAHQKVPSSDDSKKDINSSFSEQIRKGEACASECQSRNIHFEKYYLKHMVKTSEDENHSTSPHKMYHRNKKKYSETELKINRMPHPEVFKSAIDINWPNHKSKFWQTYFTRYKKDVDSKCTLSKCSSTISFYDETVCPKSIVKDEEDLFAFRLSRNNYQSSCFIVEEIPSYLLVPIRQSQKNILYLDQKRSLKMLYPLKSETGQPSSDLSAASTSNHRLFKSKTVHVLPNKFSQNYLSVNSACNLDSITSDPSFLCTANKCSGKVSSTRSVEFFNLWDAWDALDLCPLTLQNYYRKQLEKLLKDESETYLD